MVQFCSVLLMATTLVWSVAAVDAVQQPATASAEKPCAEKIAFFGDSITEGGRYLTHMQLFSALRHPGEGSECYNVGKSGDTAKGGLSRWGWDGKSVGADRVFVMFGMNDSRRSTLPTSAPTNAATPPDARESSRTTAGTWTRFLT